MVRIRCSVGPSDESRVVQVALLRQGFGVALRLSNKVAAASESVKAIKRHVYNGSAEGLLATRLGAFPA